MNHSYYTSSDVSVTSDDSCIIDLGNDGPPHPDLTKLKKACQNKHAEFQKRDIELSPTNSTDSESIYPMFTTTYCRRRSQSFSSAEGLLSLVNYGATDGKCFKNLSCSDNKSTESTGTSEKKEQAQNGTSNNIRFASSELKPQHHVIPSLHGPANLPYARCPSGAVGYSFKGTNLKPGNILVEPRNQTTALTKPNPKYTKQARKRAYTQGDSSRPASNKFHRRSNSYAPTQRSYSYQDYPSNSYYNNTPPYPISPFADTSPAFNIFNRSNFSTEHNHYVDNTFHKLAADKILSDIYHTATLMLMGYNIEEITKRGEEDRRFYLANFAQKFRSSYHDLKGFQSNQ